VHCRTQGGFFSFAVGAAWPTLKADQAAKESRMHSTPDPDVPPPQPEKDPPPDNHPLPEHAPIEEPEPPKPAVKT
jgi:hypothetical protein